LLAGGLGWGILFAGSGLGINGAACIGGLAVLALGFLAVLRRKLAARRLVAFVVLVVASLMVTTLYVNPAGKQAYVLAPPLLVSCCFLPVAVRSLLSREKRSPENTVLVIWGIVLVGAGLWFGAGWLAGRSDGTGWDSWKTVAQAASLCSLFLILLISQILGDRSVIRLGPVLGLTVCLLAAAGVATFELITLRAEADRLLAKAEKGEKVTVADYDSLLARGQGRVNRELPLQVGKAQAIWQSGDWVKAIIEVRDLANQAADPKATVGERLASQVRPHLLSVLSLGSGQPLLDDNQSECIDMVIGHREILILTDRGDIWRVGESERERISVGPGPPAIPRALAMTGNGAEGYILFDSGTLVAFRAGDSSLGARVSVQLSSRAGHGWRDLALAPAEDVLVALHQDGRVIAFDRSSGEVHVISDRKWKGDIARRVALLGDGRSGYFVDRHGGIHPFGSTPVHYRHLREAREESKGHYWAKHDFAAGLVVTNGGNSIMTVDRSSGSHWILLEEDRVHHRGEPRAAVEVADPVTAVLHVPKLSAVYTLTENSRLGVLPLAERIP
jgi:hypothetical protein